MSLLSTVADAFRVIARMCEDGLPESRHAIDLAQRALLAAGYDPGPIDGVIGPRTRAAYARARADHMAHGAMRVVRYDEPGGIDLRVEADGGPWPGERMYYAVTSEAPQVAVWHWTAGPTTAGALVDMWARSRRASSHFAIDATGIYQILPVENRGWHATWINRVAIGIDICQPVRPERIDDARASGYECEVIDNPTDPRRGSREVLSLDPRIAAKCRWLAEHLSTTYGIAKDAPRYPDGRVRHDQVFASLSDLGDWSGHLGHHHGEKASRRSDIACWWRPIFDGTPMGDRDADLVPA